MWILGIKLKFSTHRTSTYFFWTPSAPHLAPVRSFMAQAAFWGPKPKGELHAISGLSSLTPCSPNSRRSASWLSSPLPLGEATAVCGIYYSHYHLDMSWAERWVACATQLSCFFAQGSLTVFLSLYKPWTKLLAHIRCLVRCFHRRRAGWVWPAEVPVLEIPRKLLKWPTQRIALLSFAHTQLPGKHLLRIWVTPFVRLGAWRSGTEPHSSAVEMHTVLWGCDRLFWIS